MYGKEFIEHQAVHRLRETVMQASKDIDPEMFADVLELLARQARKRLTGDSSIFNHF